MRVTTEREVPSSKTFRVRNSAMIRRSWKRCALRFAARVLRAWSEYDAAFLLDTIAENIMYDVPRPRTPSEEWG